MEPQSYGHLLALLLESNYSKNHIIGTQVLTPQEVFLESPEMTFPPRIWFPQTYSFEFVVFPGPETLDYEHSKVSK